MYIFLANRITKGYDAINAAKITNKLCVIVLLKKINETIKAAMLMATLSP